MPIIHFPTLVALFTMLAFSLVQAQGHQHNHEPHGMVSGSSQTAHVHGLAALLVVLEDNQLDIELHSPAMNLLGFEHYASSPEQQTRVQSAKEILRDANNLFQLGSTQCRLIDHEMDFSSVVEKDIQHDKDHHAESHHSDHHDSRSDAHDHSDIAANYRYQCQRPDRLDSLTVNVIALFPGIESLEVQWIVNGRQGAVTLDNSRHHVVFR